MPANKPAANQMDFTTAQKAQIMRRGNYKCAVCGRGKKEGAELHVDRIRSEDQGGKATIANGQVLCSAHNSKNKNHSQTETSKELFVNLHSRAKAIGDHDLMRFAKDVLANYEKHGINGHIVWKPGNKSSKR